MERLDLKILAIDDNRDNLTSLQAVMADQLPGVRFIGALDGAQGIDLAIAEDPDVILLDIVMPRMDGYAVCRKLKEDLRLGEIPVVFFTALRGDRASRIKALEAGGEGFLAKPFDEVELAAQIRTMAKVKAANRSKRSEKERLSALVAHRTRQLEAELAAHRQAEESLRETSARLKAVIDNSPLLISEFDTEGRYTMVNHAVGSFFKMPPSELIGKTFDELLPADTVEQFMARLTRVMETRAAFTVEDRLPADTSERCFFTAVFPLFDASGNIRSIGGIAHDITERKRAEQEREHLQAQLLQAQKMEAVGRLAGGVAHDFNNMLGVILGYTELVLEQVDPEQPFFGSLQEIQKAAMRSADLTRQLLAFARKQEIHPRVLDLNRAVEGILKILRRLIGEDIELRWHPGRDLWPVHMDPAQIDQILANLCVNARDAIGGVGKIAIETRNVCFEADDCTNGDVFVPGAYVQLIFSDDGCGMDPETLANLFEPFFTTKAQGEGTGLGLATVYGVVKQNNGFIDVQSRPGQGTVFRIYFPRHEGQSESPDGRKAVQIPMARGETVLIVEDEMPILTLAANILKRLGYRVLEATTPGRAMEVVKAQASRIDLLITDVIMPEMNGRDLADRLQAQDPDLKVLFMSGYTADLIARRGVLETAVHFIQKPFTKEQIAIKVRQALGDWTGG